MTNFQECLICERNSKKPKSNKTNSQIRAIFILRELLDISHSTCVNLLQNQGTHPSSWFSCCLECSAKITEAEKIVRKLAKLKLQLKNVKNSLKKKLQISHHHVKTGAEEKTEDLINTKIPIQLIRDEALCRIVEEFGVLPELKAKDVSNILDVKSEPCRTDFCDDDFENYDAYLGTNDENDINDVKDSLPVNCSVQRTRSGRLIQAKRLANSDVTSYCMFDVFSDDSDENIEQAETDEENEEHSVPLKKNDKRKRALKRKSLSSDECNNKESKAIKGEKLKHTCQHCFNVYTNSNQKNAHENRVHGENHLFNCMECGKTYPSLYTLHRHVKTHHKVETDVNPQEICANAYPCGKCKKSFDSLKGLKRHDRRHSLKLYKCRHCKERFGNDESVKMHISKEHSNEENPLQCKECDKILLTNNGLKFHIKTIHRKEKDFICEICSAAFSTNAYLQLHQLKLHEKSEKLQCKECGKILSNPASLRRHIENIHHGTYKFVCPICGTGKVSKSSLDLHVLQSHSDGPKPFPCTLCSKTYSTRYLLNSHMRRHTGERPFKCQVCPSTFYDKKRLGRHMAGIHYTERRHECKICGKKFPSQHYLSSHIYTTHNKKKSTLPPKNIVSKEQIEQILNPVPITIYENGMDEGEDLMLS